MRGSKLSRSKQRHHQRQSKQHLHAGRRRGRKQHARPVAAYRQRRIAGSGRSEVFSAPEVWHEPKGLSEVRFVVEAAGAGYLHPVGVEELSRRIEQLPARFTRDLEVVQLSRMTRKRALFPCYGMQWGASVYLYPIEQSLVERYLRPPTPQQLIEADMYGGRWRQDGNLWRLEWSRETIKDFYLNNVLIHEIGHINDNRNTNFDARERYANWFAVEYGYRASRGRR